MTFDTSWARELGPALPVQGDPIGAHSSLRSECADPTAAATDSELIEDLLRRPYDEELETYEELIARVSR